MYRVCTIAMVDEADDGFNAFGHHERRSRHYAIIADQPGWGQIRIYLICGRLDVDLIVVDRLASAVVGEDTMAISMLLSIGEHNLRLWLFDRSNWQCHAEEVLVLWALPAGNDGINP